MTAVTGKDVPSTVLEDEDRVIDDVATERPNSAFGEGAIDAMWTKPVLGDAAPRKGGDGEEQGGERPEEKRDAAEKEGVRAAVRGGEGGERRLWAHRDQNKGVGRGVSGGNEGPNIGKQEGKRSERGGRRPAA
ncbi:hypothetical protein Syun_001355 [Stephania yunnanensis]|uniref:Uncharacterized protein n=1 Tax=Stephania yunnanensis TaxID=152371 RepID=A0AAP0LGH7_9MAGN